MVLLLRIIIMTVGSIGAVGLTRKLMKYSVGGTFVSPIIVVGWAVGRLFCCICMLFTHTVFDSISYAFPFVYRFLMWYANCVHSSTLFVLRKQKERTAIRRSFFKSVWCYFLSLFPLFSLLILMLAVMQRVSMGTYIPATTALYAMTITVGIFAPSIFGTTTGARVSKADRTIRNGNNIMRKLLSLIFFLIMIVTLLSLVFWCLG